MTPNHSILFDMKKKSLLAVLAFLPLALLSQSRPADPMATPETVNLFRNLNVLQHRMLLFGHQDALAYGCSWWNVPGRSDVKEVCGDYPAVYGWELGHLEQGHAISLDSVEFKNIRNWISLAHSRGGFNTISWHLRNPLTGGSAWDVSSKEVVASILPGGAKHDLFLSYLDRVADFLLSLKAADGSYIPVFFRPFHEHTGSWFWWGKDLCSPEQYKELWRFTVLYFREKKNIHHVLYAYSTDRFGSADEYLERYPGDDAIDMLAFDLYDRGPEYGQLLGSCAGIVSGLAAERGKIAAVSEAGGKIITDTGWWMEKVLPALRPHALSYVLVWRNPQRDPKAAFAPFTGHPGEDDFRKFYQDPHTGFQHDVTPLKLYK